MYNLMFIFEYKDGKCIETKGSVLSIKELSEFLDRKISSVYRSLKILKSKKEKDLILKDKNKNKYLIITENELNGRVWYK